jgi:hypothetical protein
VVIIIIHEFSFRLEIQVLPHSSLSLSDSDSLSLELSLVRLCEHNYVPGFVRPIDREGNLYFEPSPVLSREPFIIFDTDILYDSFLHAKTKVGEDHHPLMPTHQFAG